MAICNGVGIENNDGNWRAERDQLIAKNDTHRFSFHRQPLTKEELILGKKLQLYQQQFLDDKDFATTPFFIKGFADSRQKLESSRLFGLFKQMPKGVVQHTHFGAAIPAHHLLKNTYHNRCYFCRKAKIFRILPISFKKGTSNFIYKDYEPCSKVREEYPGGAKAFDEYVLKELVVLPDVCGVNNNGMDTHGIWAHHFQFWFTRWSDMCSHEELFYENLRAIMQAFYEDGCQGVVIKALLGVPYLAGDVADFYEKVVLCGENGLSEEEIAECRRNLRLDDLDATDGTEGNRTDRANSANSENQQDHLTVEEKNAIMAAKVVKNVSGSQLVPTPEEVKQTRKVIFEFQSSEPGKKNFYMRYAAGAVKLGGGQLVKNAIALTKEWLDNDREYCYEYFRENEVRLAPIICSFDLVAEEDTCPPISDFSDDILEAFGKDFPLTLHAGENTNGDNPNCFDALSLESSSRIGHGFNLLFHPELIKEVKERNIILETCPISNKFLGCCCDLRYHPAKALLRHGVQLTISPDDPTPFGYAGVTHDWAHAWLAWQINVKDLKQMLENSFYDVEICEKRIERRGRETIKGGLSEEMVEIEAEKRDLVAAREEFELKWQRFLEVLD